MFPMLFYIFMVVQIIVESFPVSSSGHVALLMDWLSARYSMQEILYNGIPASRLLPLLDHAVHWVTLCVVGIFFLKNWFFLLIYLVTHFFRCWHLIKTYIVLLGCSSVLTAGWFLLFSWLGTAWFPLPLGFCITAGLLWSLRSCPVHAKQRSFSVLETAVVLGMMQGVALLPGISRFASTFTVARWLGYRPERALELSLLLHMPLIIPACIRSMYGLWKLHALGIMFDTMGLLIILFAGLLAWIALWLVYRCVVQNKLWLFAWYMIIPILLSSIFIFM